MLGVGTAYQEMGEALETIETVGTDKSLTLTSIQPKNQEYLDDKILSVRFGIQIPFFQSRSITETVTITPCDTEIADDGSLHVECQATIKQQKASNHAQPSKTKENANSSLSQTETQIPNGQGRKSASKEYSTAGEHEESTIDAESDESDEPSESDPTDKRPGTAGLEERTQSDNGETELRNADSNNSTDAEADSSRPTPDNDDMSSTITEESVSKPPSRPPYRDPNRLETVYEEYDTFAQMTEALDVDVTPQTVRRYMIQHGIHEPESRSGPTSADSLLEMDPDEIPAFNGDKDKHGDGGESANQTSQTSNLQDKTTGTPLVTNGNRAKLESESESGRDLPSKDERKQSESVKMTESPQEEENEGDDSPAEGERELNTDNIETDDGASDTANVVDFPPDLTLSEVKTVVQEVKTLYEAQQQLDLERDETRRLLQELNLLDLVQGRLATRGLEERTIEDINRRIQSAAVANEGVSN